MPPSLHGKFAAYLEDCDSAPFTSFQGLTPWFKSLAELQSYIASENEPVENNDEEIAATATVTWQGTFETLCSDEVKPAQFVRAKFYESLGTEVADENNVPAIAPKLISAFSDWLETEPLKFGEI